MAISTAYYGLTLFVYIELICAFGCHILVVVCPKLVKVILNPFSYRKFLEISAALGNSATMINLPNNYWGNSPTPDSSRDTFRQKSATK